MTPSPLRTAAARYRGEAPSLYYYAIGKIWLDPAYPATARILRDSPLPLLDIGCGMGLLAAYLRANGHRAPITGLDVDAEKTTLAQKLLGAEQATFSTGDARDLPPHQGDIVMLDVLHYLTDTQQQDLLRAIADRLAPGGTALIRIALRQANLRYALTQLEESFIKLVRWIPTTGRNFPTRDEVLAGFPPKEFETTVRPMWGYTPFNSYLFVIRRKALSA